MKQNRQQEGFSISVGGNFWGENTALGEQLGLLMLERGVVGALRRC